MSDFEPSIVVPLVAGIVALVGGLLLVRYRRSFFDETAKIQRGLVGRPTSRAFERLQSPFWIGVVGVGASGMGIVLIVACVVAFVRASAGG
ncbi:hypothetical protein ACIQTT_10165 [Microbacterium sp. NPDC090225]|uniref:hypothetical protein n=1 Tax=Microbacterium sp. NPDC090225 TaxID=3364207 RepID=UPI0037F5142C